jgi:hypothetical protein
LQVLSGVNSQTNELIKLQRKIAAYQQVQHEMTNQLYSISTALLLQDDRMLDAALRQLSQFGYDLERMEFVAKEEAEILSQVRQDYDRFTAEVTHVVDLVRTGRTDEARKAQMAVIVPLADRLERLTNQLVNMAEADMVAAIETTQGAYGTSRLIVASFAVGSILLALGLGYIISWSLIEPVKEDRNTPARSRLASLTSRSPSPIATSLECLLATSTRRPRSWDGSIRIEARNRRADRGARTADGDQRNPACHCCLSTDIQPVLNAVCESAAKLCDAYDAAILLKDSESLAIQGASRDRSRSTLSKAIRRDWVAGRAFVDRKPVHVDDLSTAGDDFRWPGDGDAARPSDHASPAAPAEDEAIGALIIRRAKRAHSTASRSNCLATFADQAVIAIENVRLFGGSRAHRRTCPLGWRIGGARGSKPGRQFHTGPRHGAEDDRREGGSTVRHRCRHYLRF